MVQDELDRLAQLLAMVLGHLESPEGMGIGVAGAAGDEQGRGAGVIGLDPVLGVAGIVGVDPHHVGAVGGVVAGYGDDSAEMQTAAGGAPTMNLVVPVRYTHAHNGIMNRRDFDETVNLVTDMLLSLDQKTVDALRDWTPRQP